jgi:adenylosuccinate synthase
MGNVAVVGAQWGDEGKGKIVDWLSERADVVVRFQGGHNAGHTLVIEGVTYKLSLLPSGVVRKGKLSLIGNGVVVDPWALLKEIETLRGQGVAVSAENLRIAENAPLILPLHGELDRAREAAREGSDEGRQDRHDGRGIGPAYEDKTARRAIRVCDLADEGTLGAKVHELLPAPQRAPPRLRRGRGRRGEAAGRAAGAGAQAPAVRRAGLGALAELKRAGRRILFEGAQGAMLDVDHGTYPFVTSSNTLAAAAALGSGVGPDSVGFVLGNLQGLHHPRGLRPVPDRAARRGRPRHRRARARVRHGHRPAAPGRLARRGAGPPSRSSSAASRAGAHQARRAGRDRDPEGLHRLQPPGPAPAPPAGRHGAQAAARPVYEEMEGWAESTRGARSFAELPASAVKYVKRLEELVECPVALLSTSPDRDDTILMRDPFAD